MPTPADDVRVHLAGDWRDGAAGWLEVLDPATARAVGRVALASPGDADDAVAAAAGAFHEWASTPAHERGAIVRRAGELVGARIAEIAHGLSVESGKTANEARVEVARAAETLIWNGEEAGRVEGRVLAGKTTASHRLALPVPVGVVAAFTAWNFPAVLTARKLGAILASGCTAVLKAAEATPATAAAIVQCLVDAGAPPGAVNLVFGDPAAISARLIAAPDVRAVTFTGSTAVGRIVAGQAAAGLKRVVLELGGHAPVLVTDDGDPELAVRATVAAKFGSAGQSCVAPSRYFVHERHHAAVVERLAGAARGLRCGRFDESGVDMGPVIDERRLAALERLTQDAVARGARLVCGGRRLERAGCFWSPTVLADVPGEALVMREEPFGPIAVVNRFADLDAALQAANATDYAFAAYVFCDSLRTRARVLGSLHASNIAINQTAAALPDAPLGGMRDSGVGYEGGRDGIAAFQHLRLVSETAA